MKHVGDQSVFKGEVKQWLKSHDLDYKWMAQQCGVSEITVRNWMSQKTIPPLKQQLIERVMAQLPVSIPSLTPIDTPGVEVDASLTLTVKLSPTLYNKLESKASKQGQTLGEMVAKAISGLVAEETPSVALKGQKVVLPPKS
ncbi:hypothetical protein [Akkermansia sp.]|uniref:hypothetical protein n=1 Tax=Akkermansia sp. TaxID=1872421 RepID=UPI003AB4B5AB